MEISMDNWTYWLTALIFTCVGWFMARNEPPSFKHSKRITQETIDTLIEMGYLKTQGLGDNQELVKWYDTQKEND